MDNKNSKNDLKLDGAYRTSAILLGLAVVTACFAYTKTEPLSLGQILLYVLAGIFAAVAILIIAVARKIKRLLLINRNYFLYDRKTRRDMPLENLTFSHIRERIQKYMSAFRRGGKLYVGDLFDEEIPIPSAYRALFCFELLYELGENAEAKEHERVRMFLSFGDECASALSRHLSAAGESELAEKIRYYFSQYSAGNTDISGFEQYLTELKSHLEKVTVKYTTEHINEFSH